MVQGESGTAAPSGAAAQHQPGWYPDPHARGSHRWWSGTAWTSHITVNGQTIDEAAPAFPHPPVPSSSPPVPTTTGELMADAHPAMRVLFAQPHLVYRELEPEVFGGRVEIYGADNALLAVAEAPEKSTAYGAWGKEVTIHVGLADGRHLGTLVRPKSSSRENHPVLDEHGQFAGEFIGPVLTPTVEIKTVRGVVGRINYGLQQSSILTPQGQPLIRCTHSENFHLVESGRKLLRNDPEPDSFVLEKFGPVPAWLFLFGLLMPVETNMRVDRSRMETAGSSRTNGLTFWPF